MLRVRPVLYRLSTGGIIFNSASMATEPVKVDKAALKALRSRTGFSYVNCRKALLEFGNDKLDEAEKWLRELAAKEGWQKAAKLSTRQTKHGLVSVLAQGTRAALVEINCETDFVARGDQFKNLVERVTAASLESAKTFDPLPGEKISLVFKDFDSLDMTDGTSARDALNATIHKLGENMVVPPVTLILSQPEVTLLGCTHPHEGTESVEMGKFAAVVGLERDAEDPFPLEKAETMGSPPEKNEGVGSAGKDDGSAKIGANGDADEKKEVSRDESNDFANVETTQVDEKETRLLRQSFMLNPSQSVYDYVTGHGVKIIDFYRAEIGEKPGEE